MATVVPIWTQTVITNNQLSTPTTFLGPTEFVRHVPGGSTQFYRTSSLMTVSHYNSERRRRRLSQVGVLCVCSCLRLRCTRRRLQLNPQQDRTDLVWLQRQRVPDTTPLANCYTPADHQRKASVAAFAVDFAARSSCMRGNKRPQIAVGV